MDNSWQRQWTPSRRQDNIRKILGVLQQSQLTGSDSMQSLTDMATKFEDSVFQTAESTEKYLSKIATRLAKITEKIRGSQGPQQMVHSAPLHIPPGHMPVSQLGGGSQMLNQQSGSNPLLRSNSPSLYGGGSAGYPSGGQGFNTQSQANTLPMGPAGGVPITALGMGGAPPGSFGYNPEHNRQSPGLNYQQPGNQSLVKGQQMPAQQVKNSMPPNLTPQQQQQWLELRRREYQQRQQTANQGVKQPPFSSAQKQQQLLQQMTLQSSNAQLLTPQQQQQLLMQQHQNRSQLQQGGGMQANNQGRPASAPEMDLEQLWQNLQRLKAKYYEPLMKTYKQISAHLTANQGRPESLSMLKSFAEKLLGTLQAQDRNQALAVQHNFPKGLPHFEHQLIQLLSTWHKSSKPDANRKVQEQQDAMRKEAQELQARQKQEQEVLRKRQQQQHEQLLKQQQQQQQQHQQQQQAQQAQQAQQRAAAQQALQQSQQQSAPVPKPKTIQQQAYEYVVQVYAKKANMSVQQFHQVMTTNPEVKKRVVLEASKIQQKMEQQRLAHQQANAQQTQQQAAAQVLPTAQHPAHKLNSFSPPQMPAQTPPPDTFRAPSPVEAYKPFSPFQDNFKAPTPPFQNATPPIVPGKQLSASGGGSIVSSPGVSAAGPLSPRLECEGKPPTPGVSKSISKESSLKEAASTSNLTKAEVDPEDLPIAALRSQRSSDSPRENPIKALAKKVWLLSQSSQSQSTLEQAASDIDQLVQLSNQFALVPKGVDAKSARPENLVANARAWLANKEVKRGRLTSNKSVVSVGIEGSEFDAGSSISDANSCVDFQHSGDEAGSEKGRKRARFGAQTALEGEIEDVNRFLIDTRVEVSWEGTKDAEMEGKKGIAVLCIYSGGGITLSPLRLLVPPSYPAASPSVWHDYAAPHFSLPLAVTARENFSVAVRRLSAPLSIGAMARCWDQSVRDALADLTLSQGGGCFSNTVGVWMQCG